MCLGVYTSVETDDRPFLDNGRGRAARASPNRDPGERMALDMVGVESSMDRVRRDLLTPEAPVSYTIVVSITAGRFASRAGCLPPYLLRWHCSCQGTHCTCLVHVRNLTQGCVGTGGHATVYAARDSKHHRMVALKVTALSDGEGNARELAAVRPIAASSSLIPFRVVALCACFCLLTRCTCVSEPWFKHLMDFHERGRAPGLGVGTAPERARYGSFSVGIHRRRRQALSGVSCPTAMLNAHVF